MTTAYKTLGLTFPIDTLGVVESHCCEQWRLLVLLRGLPPKYCDKEEAVYVFAAVRESRCFIAVGSGFYSINGRISR